MEASHGNQKGKYVSLEVVHKAILFINKEDVSNQVRQAFDDATFTSVVGEGEDGCDETGTGAI